MNESDINEEMDAGIDVLQKVFYMRSSSRVRIGSLDVELLHKKDAYYSPELLYLVYRSAYEEEHLSPDYVSQGSTPINP